MFCDRCGTQVDEGHSFCPACGRSLRPTPLMPAKSRLAGHIRLLAILWFAASALRLFPGMVLLAMFGGHHNFFPPDVPFFVPALLRLAGTLFIGGAAIGLLTGWGLLDRQPWARILAVVLACFSLLDVPFGTALGIYTLWVLLPAQSEEEYRQIAKAD